MIGPKLKDIRNKETFLLDKRKRYILLGLGVTLGALYKLEVRLT